MEVIAFEDVSFTYPGNDFPTLKKISFGIRASEFVLLCGKSGCGKSTLLRQLKTNLAPYGELQGRILYRDQEIKNLNPRTNAARIGFVQQNPDNQIVTDQVWHELAFGLESLGYDQGTIRRRVAEMASFFNMQSWFRKKTALLSGGQKQLLNLAATMVMNPQVLVLDEPTAQLDPIAATDFIETLQKINRELGVTVLISEHRLEELFPIADRVMVMNSGEVTFFDTPRHVGLRLTPDEKSGMFYGLPAAMKIFGEVRDKTARKEGDCPLTIRESRLWLSEFLGEPAWDTEEIQKPKKEAPWRGLRESLRAPKDPNAAILLDDVWFRYDNRGGDVLRGVRLLVKKGESFALLGGNGAGKSTTLKVLAGIVKPQRGKASVQGRLGMVPQNPQALFTEITVKEELIEALCDVKIRDEKKERIALSMMETMGLSGMEDTHPYDLSGGEQQRLALGKVLLLEPEILVLDEPTKGLDPFFKQTLADILKKLVEKGVSILMASHDVEFCAENADRCGLFFDGDLVSCGSAKEFFAGNRFYTTSANRVVGAWFPDTITWKEAADRCEEAIARRG